MVLSIQVSSCQVLRMLFTASPDSHCATLPSTSIESIVRITGITMYMLIRSPLLGGCALCIVPVVAIINKKYGDWLRKNAIAVQTALAEANSVAQEALACVRTVIGFAAEDFELEKYSDKINIQYDLNIRQVSARAASKSRTDICSVQTHSRSVLLF